MTECIKARQWLYRALRTAVQAAAGVVAANLAAWVSGIHDGASVKTCRGQFFSVVPACQQAG